MRGEKVKNPDLYDFFNFQIQVDEDGEFTIKLKGKALKQELAEEIYEIRKGYVRVKEQRRRLRSDYRHLKKHHEESLKTRTHRKHSYQRAVAEHQNITNHLRRQIRAFEQLAKANEESKREIERNKQSKFSIGE